MPDRRVQREWEAFCAACFSPDISKQQRIDLRRTFFAGVKGFINILYESSPAEPAENLLSSIQAELLTFNEDVKAGKA